MAQIHVTKEALEETLQIVLDAVDDLRYCIERIEKYFPDGFIVTGAPRVGDTLPNLGKFVAICRVEIMTAGTAGLLHKSSDVYARERAARLAAEAAKKRRPGPRPNPAVEKARKKKVPVIRAKAVPRPPQKPEPPAYYTTRMAYTGIQHPSFGVFCQKIARHPKMVLTNVHALW